MYETKLIENMLKYVKHYKVHSHLVIIIYSQQNSVLWEKSMSNMSLSI